LCAVITAAASTSTIANTATTNIAITTIFWMLSLDSLQAQIIVTHVFYALQK
jgi:hypothetical protein